MKLQQFDSGEKLKHLVSYEPWRRVQIGPMPTEIQAYIHGSLVQVNDGVVVVTSAYAKFVKAHLLVIVKRILLNAETNLCF